LVVAFIEKALPTDISEWTRAAVLFGANVVVGFIALELARRSARQRRQLVEESRITQPAGGEVKHATS